MARLIVNQGLQTIGERASLAAPTFGQIRSGSIDDSAVALAATDTAANSGGAITNFLSIAFDATFPSRVGQVVTHQITVAAGSFNGNTIKRVLLHNDVQANATAGSITLVGGVDALSFLKAATFALILQEQITYSSV